MVLIPKKMKKIITVTIVLLVLSSSIKAQQDAMFTHYMYNTLWLNPAYAGTRDALTITGIHRSQWVGFDGAPVDQTLTMHTPIMKGKMGVGLSVLNDKIGPTKSTIMALDLDYQIKLNAKSKLSFGLKGLANFYSNNINALELDNQQDIAFSENTQRILPNTGAGIYYYRERFYAGISVPKLMENKFNSNSLNATSKEQRHYFLILGTVFDLGKDLKLKPTCFIKATQAAPIEGDVTANFIIKDTFTIGAMYRTGDGVGALLGYNFTEQFTVGYSFDWSMANTTGKYNNGSHEIMLRYDLISKTKAKIKSPRFF
jgi:type IX secretion system PorP/SprF family membrane protein